MLSQNPEDHGRDDCCNDHGDEEYLDRQARAVELFQAHPEDSCDE